MKRFGPGGHRKYSRPLLTVLCEYMIWKAGLESPTPIQPPDHSTALPGAVESLIALGPRPFRAEGWRKTPEDL